MFGRKRIEPTAIDLAFDAAIAEEFNKPLAGLDPDVERTSLKEGLEDAQFLAETIKTEIARLQVELANTQAIIAARKSGLDSLEPVTVTIEEALNSGKGKAIVMKHTGIKTDA